MRKHAAECAGQGVCRAMHLQFAVEIGFNMLGDFHPGRVQQHRDDRHQSHPDHVSRRGKEQHPIDLENLGIEGQHARLRTGAGIEQKSCRACVALPHADRDEYEMGGKRRRQEHRGQNEKMFDALVQEPQRRRERDRKRDRDRRGSAGPDGLEKIHLAVPRDPHRA